MRSSKIDVMEVRPARAKPSAGKSASTAKHHTAAAPFDEHLRLKKSTANAKCMDAAVKQMAAGKGVEWNPFSD